MLERDKEPNTNSIERARAQTGTSGSNAKLQDHNHNREVVFALPSLRLHFKTEHVQGAATPDLSGNCGLFSGLSATAVAILSNFPALSTLIYFRGKTGR